MNLNAMESPNTVTVIVMEDEASARLLEGSCSERSMDKKKKSLWKRLFSASERSARSLGSRTAYTSGSSSNRASLSARNLSSSCHDSVLSCDDEDDDCLFCPDESFAALTTEQEEVLQSPQSDGEQESENDVVDCADVCAVNSFSAIAGPDTPPEEELNDESRLLNAEALLEEAQAARIEGDNRRALDLYERVLFQELDFSPIQMANLCYACTWLAFHLQEPRAALHYAKRELAYTLQISQEQPTMAVSKCYHELARISRVGLGESDRAIKFYRKALRIEEQVYRSITAVGTARTAQAQEILQHIQETKECIGRILFEKGNIAEALGML